MALWLPPSVSGPLEGFADGVFEFLGGLGYAQRSIETQGYLMRDLSAWSKARNLGAGDLTVEVVGRYVVDRRKRYRAMRSERALAPLLGYLRSLGIAPAPEQFDCHGIDAVVERFSRYLALERALAADTVRSYTSQVRPFLERYASDDAVLRALRPREVAAFVTECAAGGRPRSAAVKLNALRCLLRWMWREQMISAPLADAVGSVAAPYGLAPPAGFTNSEIAAIGAALSADPLTRRRDEAMLALMWRSGLRSGEVAVLALDDIDWRAGLMRVHGKGGRVDVMPLPVDVGRLLVAYLRDSRPAGTGQRQVFLAVDAPHAPVSRAAVSSVAARAIRLAGVEGHGAAHRFRHTAACRVLAGGGGLVEAGQLLRHASASATAHYARSDLASLALLARPWPGADR